MVECAIGLRDVHGAFAVGPTGFAQGGLADHKRSSQRRLPGEQTRAACQARWAHSLRVAFMLLMSQSVCGSLSIASVTLRNAWITVE